MVPSVVTCFTYPQFIEEYLRTKDYHGRFLLLFDNYGFNVRAFMTIYDSIKPFSDVFVGEVY